MKKIKLITIVGTDRSGSTLLDKIISSNPAMVSVGEVHHLFYYSEHNLKCTCGRPFSNCGFWENILLKLEDSHFECKQISVLGWRKRLRVLLESIILPTSVIKRKYIKFAKAYAFLCQAVIENTGSEYVVDSCKDITRVYLLYISGLFEIFPIYITRPVEDYLISIKKPQMRININRKLGDKKSILRWSYRNLETRLLLPIICKNYIQISYKKLISDTEKVINSISELLNIPSSYDPVAIQNKKYHFLGGNFMKFETFSGIKPDVKDISSILNSSTQASVCKHLDRIFVKDTI